MQVCITIKWFYRTKMDILNSDLETYFAGRIIQARFSRKVQAKRYKGKAKNNHGNFFFFFLYIFTLILLSLFLSFFFRFAFLILSFFLWASKF